MTTKDKFHREAQRLRLERKIEDYVAACETHLDMMLSFGKSVTGRKAREGAYERLQKELDEIFDDS